MKPEQAIRDSMEKRCDFDTEYRTLRPDGTVRWISAKGRFFDGVNGSPQRMEGVISDITERKRLEQEVQRSERNLNTILNNIPSLVGYWDKDLYNRFGNQPYCDWFGMDPTQLIGLHYRDVLGNETLRSNMPYIEAVLAGHPQSFERSIPSPDGTIERYDLVHYIPDVTGGEVQGFYAVVWDITPLKLAEKHRKQLAKAESLNRMAGAIAHNFNNHLYVVTGNLELLMDSTPLGSENHVMAADALAASRKAADISKMMLTYLGQSPGKQEVQDLSEICHKALLMARAAIPDNVFINTELPVPGPTVNANTKQLLQIVDHLVANACESITDRQGTVSVSVKTVSAADISDSNRFPAGWQPKEIRYACLGVIDTGCGVPTENIEKIFDPFFTTKFTGRGLGLSVVLGIIRTHGGTITVENIAGGGCAFRVYLPLASKIIPVETETTQIEK